MKPFIYKNICRNCKYVLDTIYGAGFLLNAQPSVSTAFPLAGVQSTNPHLGQLTTVWAWLKATLMFLQAAHLTSMK